MSDRCRHLRMHSGPRGTHGIKYMCKSGCCSWLPHLGHSESRRTDLCGASRLCSAHWHPLAVQILRWRSRKIPALAPTSLPPHSTPLRVGHGPSLHGAHTCRARSLHVVRELCRQPSSANGGIVCRKGHIRSPRAAATVPPVERVRALRRTWLLPSWSTSSRLARRASSRRCSIFTRPPNGRMPWEEEYAQLVHRSAEDDTFAVGELSLRPTRP